LEGFLGARVLAVARAIEDGFDARAYSPLALTPDPLGPLGDYVLVFDTDVNVIAMAE